MIRQAILKDKHGAQHMFCFEEFKHSSSCIPKCNSFYLIFWGGVMSLLTISLRDSQVVRNELIKSIIFSSFKISFRPINLFVGVILGYISLKAFPKECCYCGAYQWSKFSPILSAEEVFHLLVDLKQAIVSFCGRISPQVFEMFSISPRESYLLLLIFQQLRSTLLPKDGFQIHLW